MGCQNRVVTAGLEALLNNVAQPFPKVREVLDGYGIMSLEEREENLRTALEFARGRTKTNSEYETRAS